MADEQFFTQRFMEGFGLDFPKDADRFVDILERFDEDGGTIGQLFEEVVEAFSDKKDQILSLPIHIGFDGGY